MTERTDLPRLATRAEAADALRVSTKTIDRLIAAGTLRAVNVGSRSVRVTAESLEALTTSK